MYTGLGVVHPSLYRRPAHNARAYLIGDVVSAPRGLGFVDPATLYAAYKTGTTIANVASNIFGGGNQDAKRQQRVNYMLDAAKRGSVLAARIILQAPNEVGGNEQRQWAQAQLQVPADVMQRARAQGGFWPTGQPFEMPNQVAAIESELGSLGQQSATSIVAPAQYNTSAPGSSDFPSGPAHPITGMTTTAPYNYTPLVIGLGIGALALALSKR